MRADFAEIVPGKVAYLENFISAEDSARLMTAIIATSHWTQEKLRVKDMVVPFPRLVSWHGDDGVPYHYSGVSHSPVGWTVPLEEVRARITDLLSDLIPLHPMHASGGRFPNGCLLNRYRDGRDSIGKHADREEDLVPGAPILGVSLGAAREIRFRPMAKFRDDGEPVTYRDEVRITLSNGSLLLMHGDCQRTWTHEIRKLAAADDCGERVSLTFRCVETSIDETEG